MLNMSADPYQIENTTSGVTELAELAGGVQENEIHARTLSNSIGA